MPANLTPEYKSAEAAFRKARDPRERLERLREMLHVIPKHKGTDHLSLVGHRTDARAESTPKSCAPASASRDEASARPHLAQPATVFLERRLGCRWRSVRRIVLHLPMTFPWLPAWGQIARAVGTTSERARLTQVRARPRQLGSRRRPTPAALHRRRRASGDALGRIANAIGRSMARDGLPRCRQSRRTRCSSH